MRNCVFFHEYICYIKNASIERNVSRENPEGPGGPLPTKPMV